MARLGSSLVIRLMVGETVTFSVVTGEDGMARLGNSLVI